MSKRPNLLFVMTDHQRADSLGMVQAGVEVTPRLDALAAESVQFTRAYTTSPVCVPARSALATGLYPSRLQANLADPQANPVLTLHEQLAEHSYDVGHIGVDQIRLAPPLAERVDWSVWSTRKQHDERVGSRYDDPDGKVFWQEIRLPQGGEMVVSYKSSALTAKWPGQASAFMDCVFGSEAQAHIQARSREPEQPMALFLNLWAPHPPLRLPEPYWSMFDPERIELPENVGQPAAGEPRTRRLSSSAQLAEGLTLEDWRRAWAAHLGLVRLADDVIGRVLDTLEATGLADDTIVVFTSDHGDHLGQHRMYQKFEMYEQAVRVPCLIRMPGAGGSVCDMPVSHLDVTATVRDVLTLGGQTPDGRSLRPILEGRSLPDEPVFSQYNGNGEVGVRRAMITRSWKYVFDPHAEAELYDLVHDPLEMRNRAADPAQKNRVAAMHAELRQWHASRGDTVDYSSA